MKVVAIKYYVPALEALPASRRRQFQKRLLALIARAKAIETGEDEPMDREALGDLADDAGESLSMTLDDLPSLLEEVFDESVDPLSALLEEVRADAWPPRVQEALYACPHWVTLWIVENSLWDDEAADTMRRLTKRFLDGLAQALGLDAAARKGIESATRTLRGSDEDAEEE
ncbi:hypothetical protein OV203_26340 [Nannocystis sp. ILAH1]|uniref:hypothetical protein n=1 Tax=Nannocystis sp. ILAH1 TaxID=2996789 RepID=UPI00226FC0F2|nr:hypothetical protein [Nannocystis sp. ILAH1]MCY0990691.1 hypothetical protein [Nannocystis sp. ILAH1]